MRELNAEERALFECYLQGELPEPEALALEARLVDDDALAQAFERFARGEGASVEALEAPMPRNFTRDVEQRINRRSGGRFFVEDIVSSRFIPWFIVGSIVVLALVVIFGRANLGGSLEETPPPAEEESTGEAESAGADEAPAASSASVPAAAAGRLNRPRPEVMPMVHVASVPIVHTKLRKEELRAALYERFGESRVTELEGYFGVRVREGELGEALRRLEGIEREVTEASMEIAREEIDHPVFQVWWR